MVPTGGFAGPPLAATIDAMRRLGFSRPAGVLVLLGGLVVTIAACALIARLAAVWPALGGGAPAAPVRLAGLPAPVVTRPQWTSYTYAGPMRDLALGDGLLWAATDGGLVVWDGAGNAARFTTEHGLPANRVTSLAIGADGAIWAGTVAGLGRYDGRAWQTFTAADGLPADAIRDLAADRDGNVWAATAAGLARYDGDGWRVTGRGGLFGALPSEDVTALAVDTANRLWVATAAGLSRLAGSRWTTFTAADGLPVEPIRALAAGPGEVVWALTDVTLVRADGDAFTRFTPGLAGATTTVTYTALAPAADGTVYLAAGPDNRAVIRFDPAGPAEERLDIAPRPAARDALGALLVDPQGALWAGVGDTLRRYAGDWTTLAAPSDLPAPRLTGLATAGGGVWAASAAGVTRLDGGGQTFGVADGLASNDVRALAVAPDGTLWAAADTPLRGLSRYGPGGWQMVACPTAAPPSADVRDAAQTPTAVWLATPRGISRFDGATWRTYDARDGLPDAPVNALAAAGEVVYAATDAGIARFDGAALDGRWRMISAAPARDLAIAPNGDLWATDGLAVALVGEDAAGALPLPTTVRGLAATDDAVWLATPDGVLRYDGNWTVFTTDDGLPALDVTAIGAAADGRVWAATSGSANGIDIVWFDGRRWQPHPNRDPAAEQLAEATVYRVLAAPDGDLWLGTLAGVERYHDGRWSVYATDSGLPDDFISALASANGQVWAGTPRGLARFTGVGWELFGAPSTDAPAVAVGPAVSALAVAPSGDLWVTLEAAQQNRLRVYDGQTWRVVALPAPFAFITQMAFTPTGQLIAIVDDNGAIALGLLDGDTWTLATPAGLGLEPRALGVSPDGRRLWLTGTAPDAGAAPPDAVEELLPGQETVGAAVVVLALGPDGLGPEIGRFAAAGIAAYDWEYAGAVQPIAFGPDGRVTVAGAGQVYVFDGAADAIAPVETRALPLPFTRTTFALASAPDGRLWVGTEGGLAVLDGEAWQTFTAPARAPEWWGSATVLRPRADGGVLLGTSGGGVGVYTGNDFEGVMRPSEGPAEWAGAFPAVTALLFRGEGELWATSAAGAARLTEAWEVFLPDATLAAETIGLAATDDRLWLGTARGWAAVALAGDACRYAAVEPLAGVTALLVDRQGAVWLTAADSVLRAPAGGAPATALDSTMSVMALLPNGEVWLAGQRQPWLMRYRPGDGEGAWTRLPLDLNLVDGAALTALAVAPDLDLWLGGDGLARFRGGQWSKLTTADGLADNQVEHVLVTPDGAVWAATAGGLSRYRP